MASPINIALGTGSQASGLFCVAIGDKAIARGAFQVTVTDKLNMPELTSKPQIEMLMSQLVDVMITYKALETQKFAPPDFVPKADAAVKQVMVILQKQLDEMDTDTQDFVKKLKMLKVNN